VINLMDDKKLVEALDKAVESLDHDLILTAVFGIRDNHSFREFCRIINQRELAANMYITFCKQLDVTSLKKFYYHTHRSSAAAHLAIVEAYECREWEERLVGIEFAMRLFDMQDPFASAASAAQIQLLNYESRAENGIRQSLGSKAFNCVDTSVSELIARFLSNGQLKIAMDVKERFRVPETRMWHVILRTLAKQGDWVLLSELALTNDVHKQPPIGYESIVETCIEFGEKDEALKYINRLPEAADKMEWLCYLKRFSDAATIAIRSKDVDAMRVIRTKCNDKELQARLGPIIAAFEHQAAVAAAAAAAAAEQQKT